VSKEATTVLYFQGNAGNISFCLPNVAEMQQTLHCNVFLVSYRGYGKSTGSPTEKGLSIDAESALEYLLSRPDINPNKIVAFGRSLGGAVAIQLCTKKGDKIKALIVENTFLSIPDMVAVVFPALRHFKVLSTNQWLSLQKIKTISIPILFLCGMKDELVPSSHMERLHEYATNSTKKAIHKYPFGAHMDTWTQPNYYRHLQEFFELHNLY